MVTSLCTLVQVYVYRDVHSLLVVDSLPVHLDVHRQQAFLGTFSSLEPSLSNISGQPYFQHYYLFLHYVSQHLPLAVPPDSSLHAYFSIDFRNCHYSRGYQSRLPVSAARSEHFTITGIPRNRFTAAETRCSSQVGSAPVVF